MTNSGLKQAALSAAQGVSAKEAFHALADELIVAYKSGRIRDAEQQALMTNPAYVTSCLAAYALSVGKNVEALTDAQKKQAMLRLVLDKEGE